MRLLLLATAAALYAQAPAGRPLLRLIEIDPGHSHASSLHAYLLPGFSTEAHIYAPLGPDLTTHMESLARLDSRPGNTAHWTFRIFAGPDFLAQMIHNEPAGNVVMLAGRNGRKIDLVLGSLEAGQHVLADKPWIIDSRNLPKLEDALNHAERKGLIAYDCMTQRFDVAYQIQRELVRDPAVSGGMAPGSVEQPSVRMENLHAILKSTRRPGWFFDVDEQGEGIADVGTHLVDLAEWTLTPDAMLDYRTDAKVLRASRQSLPITLEQFTRVSGQRAWPATLAPHVKAGGVFDFYANNDAVFALRGVHVGLRVAWQYEAAPGEQDTYFTSYQGKRARIELRQGMPEKFVAQVSVIPADGVDRGAVAAAVRTRLAALQFRYPGVAMEEDGAVLRIRIPAEVRAKGGDHFVQLASQFIGYVRDPKTLPAWEKNFMLTKYYITTTAVELARRGEKR